MATATVVSTNGQVEVDLTDYSHLLDKGLEEETIFIAKLVGLSPLLMHSPAGMRAASKTPVKTSEKKIPTPEEESEQGAYRNEDGFLVIPSVAVQRCMIEAAKQYQDPQRKRATLKTKVAAAINLPLDDSFVLTREGEPVSTYDIDTRRAVVQRAAVMRSRAMIALPWEVEIQFGFDSSLIGMEHIADLLKLGGRQIGLLDYRPERSGSFGRYKVEQLKANV